MTMNWHPYLVMFLLGMVGAAAPEIVRLYSLRFTPGRFVWSWTFIFYSLPFLMLGGVLAVVTQSGTLFGAFYTGLSTPVVVNTALRKIAQDQDQHADGNGRFAQTAGAGEG